MIEESMIHVSTGILRGVMKCVTAHSALRCVALASFKHEIENLRKHLEEIDSENAQLKQASTKATEEKKRLMKEADYSLESATKTSALKLE